MEDKLQLFQDLEIQTLKEELTALESQFANLISEKAELEKFLAAFHHRHMIELGELILEILNLRKLKFRGDSVRLKESENDEKEFREQFRTEKARIIFELTTTQKKELKMIFRKATVLCHPDKVVDEHKEAAQKIFIELKQAYDINDLKRVTEILQNLQNGSYFIPKSAIVGEKLLLKSVIAQFVSQIKILETELISIKESHSFTTIISLGDLNEYFNKTREKLEADLKELQFELEI